MARYREGRTLVLAGYGFGDGGPYLTLNDMDDGARLRYPVRGRTFSLRRLPARRCIGRHDLATHEASVCPLAVELAADSKDDMCPACREATGFNPSFYNTDLISPQQRAYNDTPHFTYLAYFSPRHVKAGISSASRGDARLAEQGARAACIVGRFDTAWEARELEAALVAQPGVCETMRAAKKAELLVGERYDFAEARAVLGETARRAGVEAAEPCFDLSERYFGGPSPACADLQIPDGPADVCGGRCVGMVGGILVLEQQDALFAVPIGDWKAHEVELCEDEVLCSYAYEPQQMSLL